MSRFVSRGLWSGKGWVRVGVVLLIGIGVILASNYGLRQLREEQLLDVDFYWPLSIFVPKYPQWGDIVTIGMLMLGWWGFVVMYVRKVSWTWLGVWGMVLIVGMNLLQGVEMGLVYPIRGESWVSDEYWSDADLVYDVVAFLDTYVLIQPYLSLHSRTHPPGPILYVYGLRQIWDSVWMVGGVTLVLVGVCGWFWYDRWKVELGEEMARLLGVLVWVLPATVIYGWFSIDVVVMVSFVLTFWAWGKPESMTWWMVRGVCLWMSGWLTFAVGWLLGVLVWDDWRRHGSVWLSVKGISLWLGLTWGVQWLWGYDYWESLRLARSFEQTHVWSEWFGTLDYWITRWENVLEIVIFFGPALGYLLWLEGRRRWSAKKKRWSDVGWVGWGGMVGLLVFFMSGSYATGETARAAMYVFPFMLLPVGVWLKTRRLSVADEVLLLSAVWVQGLVMQLFGWYAW